MSDPDLSFTTEDFLLSEKAVVERFTAAGQGHVFRFLDRLDWKRKNALFLSAKSVDLDLVARLASGKSLAPPAPPPEPLEGPFVHRRQALQDNRVLREQAEAAGLALLRGGKVAILTVAGGQGTRLGFPGPKGCYPVGPGQRTLFDIHAAAVAAASREAGKPVPWILLVSPTTEEATRAYIRRRGLPGVAPAQVRIVCQGVLPALTDEGKLLLEDVDRIATAPDGHGGCLKALRLTGTLAWLVNLGVEELCYFQVDNPLAPPVDPLFLGLHRRAKGQMSSKVFLKSDPAEKVGVVVCRHGKPAVIEYTELPKEQAERKAPGGGLQYWAANMASHVLSMPFAAAVAFRGLPVHRVRKAVPFVDADGNRVVPPEPNAWKHESFVFDAMPLSAGGVVMEVDRSREFAPLKNAAGMDSPETVRLLLQSAGKW
ncbi:MAG: UTP--glucose-1-phosphate uridylyltransferase [Planctomycetaceae bacterium]|nr:UTP--glucose-1-phosphate uridylyltransferase [Planctomycetaceae bacterium]